MITDVEQYYTHPGHMDIMKCLVSKGHFCSLLGSLYPVQGGTDCALVLTFIKDNAIKLHYSITVYTISKIYWPILA